MEKYPQTLLRLGLGITFFWIGILIFQNPLSWGNYLSSWASNLFASHLYTMMLLTSFLDITIGLFLLFNFLTWVTSLLATFHLITVLIVSGITEITIRDVGLLGTSLALLIQTLPPYYKKFLKFNRDLKKHSA